MPKITFIAHDGTLRTVQAEVGQSLMLVAVNNQVAGIDGDCGGQCACATCHVFVEPDWAILLPPVATGEAEMLNFTAERTQHSRLACQISITSEMDGLTVAMPIGQH